MPKPTRRTLGVLALTTALCGGTALSASAITGGEADGERHPNVGMIFFYDDEGRFRCTASLASPTVLLTAAHCTEGTLGKTGVTFSTLIAEQGPSPLPVAADPSAGYTQEELEVAGYASGTAYTHPQYSDFTDMRNWNDVGVIFLDKPINDICPVAVAPSGFLDKFTANLLNKAIFTSVGYGTEVRKAVPTADGPNQGKRPTAESYPMLRRVADQPGQKLTSQILQLNGNLNDKKGTGGTCFGDSGGPTFKDGYQVTVTSYGYNDNCRYIGGYQRIDIPVVQDWLAGFGVTPAG